MKSFTAFATIAATLVGLAGSVHAQAQEVDTARIVNAFEGVTNACQADCAALSTAGAACLQQTPPGGILAASQATALYSCMCAAITPAAACNACIDRVGPVASQGWTRVTQSCASADFAGLTAAFNGLADAVQQNGGAIPTGAAGGAGGAPGAPGGAAPTAGATVGSGAAGPTPTGAAGAIPSAGAVPTTAAGASPSGGASAGARPGASATAGAATPTSTSAADTLQSSSAKTFVFGLLAAVLFF
ncbi:hypothetical protein HK102_007900 [Quaeritorhiza haematococci]|nr:hypothetical protein HK102_007900 [Quaeritorhiza haematococci]